ncbi:hypothetical protein [Ectobacillus ponti]|uniref:Uncharacterized protein n=1 Tax=Ectobacillus ponti TaxID=2961894 RepID=A0AA41X953_9BACI|nr:hypothetical protein [Ectobacillus ponti]MCP8971002.1 hypothetical protein [Ectobacillus ponti]
MLNWKLFIFPARADGTFQYANALFPPSCYPTMEAAWEPAAALARQAREDQLVTSAAVAAN